MIVISHYMVTPYQSSNRMRLTLFVTKIVREIYVAAGGYLKAGSETCRLFSKIDITFYGRANDSSINNTPQGATSKGLVASGIVEMHGKLYHPSWTRLQRTSELGSSY